ncbi:hypothetical protein [Moraxella lacunata]
MADLQKTLVISPKLAYNSSLFCKFFCTFLYDDWSRIIIFVAF